ncbi:MAG: deoxyribodipyrimidine photolyase, partial [Myxococcota bacterium]
MVDNLKACESAQVAYYPYVEPKHGEGAGLLEALAKNAAVLVSDDYPAFFLPAMHQAVAKRVSVRMELVDSNGLMPLSVPEKTFSTAYSFRGYLQKNLKPFLSERPQAHPFSGFDLPRATVPAEVRDRWPAADLDWLEGGSLASLAIDHTVGAPRGVKGGATEGLRLIDEFLGGILGRYGEDRNEPEKRGTSQLSPHLHYGHVSTHEIFHGLSERESGWSVERVPDKGRGSREGWWKMSAPAEGFLDELITWREIGYNMAFREGARYEEYESLPDWAQVTLDAHRDDPRDHVYDLEAFESAATHDRLWNAAQNQLVREGRIHNYLRMLWGKKILEWTERPEDAQAIMVELNNKYALDGRDPNSYSGIM